MFDGHAGNRASTYAAKHLHQHIKTHLPKGIQNQFTNVWANKSLLPFYAGLSYLLTLLSVQGTVQNLDREVKKCLLESFKKTDEEFLRMAADASPSWKDGYNFI